MPLIVLCGLPGSGKSTRAKKLQAALTECSQVPVLLVADGLLFSSTSKDALYADPAKEKNLRASIKSDIQRAISKDSIVIMDALNYIKGYRYEIFCISKASKTTQCTIWCNTPIDVAKEWNLKRPADEQYSDSTFDALVMRFEPPDSQNRWDNPLFTLLPEVPLPTSDIISVLIKRIAPPPNQSTQSQPLAATNYLHELDRITQEVNATIVAAQLRGAIGESIVIPGTADTLTFLKLVPPPELTRLRRQFISYSRTRPVENMDRIATVFVQFLKSNLMKSSQ